MSKKLPVFATLSHSCQLTFNNLGAAVRFSWAWLLAAFISLVVSMLVIRLNAAATANNLLMMLAPFILVAMVAGTSIAVAWHRYILYDEGLDQAFNLRVDATVWRYLGNQTMIGMTLIATLFPFFILGGILRDLTIVVVVLLLMVPLVYRMTIKLPAIALGNRDLTFSDTLRISRGNYLRFFALGSILGIMFGVIDVASQVIMAVGTGFGQAGAIITSLMAAAALCVYAIFAISVQTTLYGYFVEGRELDA